MTLRKYDYVNEPMDASFFENNFPQLHEICGIKNLFFNHFWQSLFHKHLINQQK